MRLFLYIFKHYDKANKEAKWGWTFEYHFYGLVHTTDPSGFWSMLRSLLQELLLTCFNLIHWWKFFFFCCRWQPKSFTHWTQRCFRRTFTNIFQLQRMQRKLISHKIVRLVVTENTSKNNQGRKPNEKMYLNQDNLFGLFLRFPQVILLLSSLLEQLLWSALWKM